MTKKQELEAQYIQARNRNIKRDIVQEWLNSNWRDRNYQEIRNEFIEWARNQQEANWEEKYMQQLERADELEETCRNAASEVDDVMDVLKDWVKKTKTIEDIEELDISEVEDQIDELDSIQDDLKI